MTATTTAAEPTVKRIERNGYRLTVDSQESQGVREYGWWIYRIDRFGIPTTVAHCHETYGDFAGAFEAGYPEFVRWAGELADNV